MLFKETGTVTVPKMTEVDKVGSLEETEIPGRNPGWHMENMQTAHLTYEAVFPGFDGERK